MTLQDSTVSLFLQTLRFSALLPALCFVVLNQLVLPQVLVGHLVCI
jgi:hypothetical protein